MDGDARANRLAIYGQTIGDRITQLRVREGMNQRALAQALGQAQPAVSRWERDQNLPSAHNLIMLTKALRCSFEEILLAPAERQLYLLDVRSRR